MCRVSVVMNVRNGASFVADALESVRAQSFRDWELLFWDDRSTDSSAAIAAAFDDPRLRYFRSTEELSLAQGRDRAMREARGEWLAFLDQDDLWGPDKLEKQMARVADAPDAGLVYGRTVIFSKRGLERDYDHRHEFEALPEGDIFERLFQKSCFISMSSVVVRRSALDSIGAMPAELAVIPDYYLFVAVARRHPALAVQDVVCCYRRHAHNMSRYSVRAMHEEALWLVAQYQGQLDPALAKQRRRIHHTLVALQDLQDPATALAGLGRLLRQGSLPFLLSRPFARAHRVLRRWFGHPRWRRDAAAARAIVRGARWPR